MGFSFCVFYARVLACFGALREAVGNRLRKCLGPLVEEVLARGGEGREWSETMHHRQRWQVVTFDGNEGESSVCMVIVGKQLNNERDCGVLE